MLKLCQNWLCVIFGPINNIELHMHYPITRTMTMAMTMATKSLSQIFGVSYMDPFSPFDFNKGHASVKPMHIISFFPFYCMISFSSGSTSSLVALLTTVISLLIGALISSTFSHVQTISSNSLLSSTDASSCRWLLLSFIHLNILFLAILTF